MRGIKPARLNLGRRRRQCPLDPLFRMHRQGGGPLHERRRGGQPTPGLCPARRPLLFGGHVLVGSRRGVRAVPSMTIGVQPRIGDLR
jgi:hypothetical protein